ncbi:unnamed protein product [Musa acuminata subsp. malaccensis]|uniref:(wild Malaysian banana) hypothetical protein n=1 Tax=Musa acuminata subsp. malaccensis TaxID=214687 RepID=A0A804KBP7_MUSAM|nr:unnamed protein product [Musa acuminata subsp. malaccensis]
MKWWDPCESPGWLSSCDSVGQLMGFKKGLNRRFPFEKEKQKRRPNGSLPSVCSPLDLLDLNQSSYGATVGFRSLCFQGARTREMDLGSKKRILEEGEQTVQWKGKEASTQEHAAPHFALAVVLGSRWGIDHVVKIADEMTARKGQELNLL